MKPNQTQQTEGGSDGPKEIEWIFPAPLDDAHKLIEIRQACLKIDRMVKLDPAKWSGSLQWVTGQIMCIAKYGEGYETHDAAAK